MFSFKKAAAGVLSCTMLLGSLVISGCSDSNTSGTQSADNTSNSSSTAHQGEIKDISSVELVKDMKIGWSLGNTLDAGNESNRGQDPGAIEKSWGNPDTTKEMIDEIKKAGFNVLRVPTTWDWSTGEAPEYKISDEWFARVKEIVDYGMENDMYVILNIHHETWHYPTEDNYEAASDRLKKVWTQIGNYFKDYDEHLIFEGLNEPRVIGTSEEWNGGSDATREVVNKLDADFVSTIRSLDGNNKLRHLMIPGYAASSSEVALKALKIPENDDKLIVSVHAYTPYNFALADSKKSNKWVACKEGFTNDIDYLANMLKTLSVICKHRLYIVYSRRFKLPAHHLLKYVSVIAPVRHTKLHTALRRISYCHDQLVSCLVLCHPVQVNCYYPHICPFQKGNDKITAFLTYLFGTAVFRLSNVLFQFIENSCIGFKTVYRIFTV